MANELEEVLKKFALSNLEQNGTCIIGKIRGEKVANFIGVKNFVTAAWGYPKNLEVAELGPNLFQFFIPEEENKLRILNGGPWLIDSQILVLNRWEAGIEENTEAFRFAPLWVQVWNLPIHWISKEAGRKIGKMFKEVKEVLISHTGGKEGKHLKMLVWANMTQPLLLGTTVKMNGVLKWINFRYERVPDFCYKCGIVGHSEKKYKNKVSIKKGQHENQYGLWLRAQNGRGSPQQKSNPSSYNPDRQVWGFQNGEWIKKSNGKKEEQGTNPSRTESVKSMALTKNAFTVEDHNVRLVDRVQEPNEGDEELLDAQVIEMHKEGAERINKVSNLESALTECEMGRMVQAVGSLVALGELGNRNLDRRMGEREDKTMDMLVDEEEHSQNKENRVSRVRKSSEARSVGSLDRRKVGWGDKWIIIGDFNDITSNDEKWCGRRRDNRSFHDFRKFINENQLLDVGYIGKPWTWSNNWYGNGEIKERLDRGLCSMKWSQCYEDARCTHIDSIASDHSMLLLETEKKRKRWKKRFQFDKRWLQHDDIVEVVKKAWDVQCEGTKWFKVKEKIKNCRIELLKWSNKKKGNSLERINWCKDQIEAIKASETENKRPRIRK
ncbi:uncharacterized protein LOC113760053 [Coffea eugenioides]|uniref:uncharacterized protein LOC113760053 n=1 Tax=Coffea eugenioides TaxID=49369 RepID=UPI000F6125B2|nr:uncharacterized protein LOC113760053 [Coffea eugenioides]